MNLFESHFDTENFEQAKKQLAEDWRSYCENELNVGVFADIGEARNMDELNGIRVFLWSLSSVVKEVNGSRSYGDYFTLLDNVREAIKDAE